MSCTAPSYARKADCPGPGGQPANLRCPKCAKGFCQAPGNAFQKNCFGPDAAPGKYACAVCKSRKALADRRKSVGNLMDAGAKGMALQSAWSARVDALVTDMWNAALIKKAPVNYALCLAGSCARNEASPYSDLDCFLLVENDAPQYVDFFKSVCEKLKQHLLEAEGTSGLRFCNIMSPFGSHGDTKAPHLIRTPQNMANLVEKPDSVINSHITGGLQEHRFLLGEQKLYDAYKVDLNVIIAKTCFTHSSRPLMSRGKKMGLQLIKETVASTKFTPPKRTDPFFHVKEQFYRPTQFLAKGLAWYYGVDAVSTADQLTQLIVQGHMSQVAANNFRAVMNAMAALRFKLHLDREGEKDFVYVDDKARDAEMKRLQSLPTADYENREKLNRLKTGTKLSAAEVRDLLDSISSLNYLIGKGRQFVAEKEKLLGTRRNPFTAA